MKTPRPSLISKLSIKTFSGWLLLGVGVLLYIVPIFYHWLGNLSALLAFALILVGISLLKMRKDQQNRH